MEKSVRNNEIRRLVIGGEKFTDVANKYGISSNSVRVIVLRECLKLNSELYLNGILKGSTNNYASPPLGYLREHFEVFGV